MVLITIPDSVVPVVITLQPQHPDVITDLDAISSHSTNIFFISISSFFMPQQLYYLSPLNSFHAMAYFNLNRIG